MKTINLYLIRHGESTANANGRDQIGQANDTDLSDLGKLQTSKLGKRLSKLEEPIFIGCSSYHRAQETKRIALGETNWKTNIDTTDALVEYSPGDWRGQNRHVIYSDINNVKNLMYKPMGFLFPSGESYHQVARRAATYIEDKIIYNKELLEKIENGNLKDNNIVIFSHGMTLRCLLFYIMGFGQDFMWRIDIDNTSICHLTYGEFGWKLKSINDTSHLLA